VKSTEKEPKTKDLSEKVALANLLLAKTDRNSIINIFLDFGIQAGLPPDKNLLDFAKNRA